MTIPGTPPPNAPHEVSQPLDGSARTIPAHLRGNERELAPVNYDGGAAPAPVPVVAAVPVAPAVRPPMPAPVAVVPVVTASVVVAPPVPPAGATTAISTPTPPVVPITAPVAPIVPPLGTPVAPVAPVAPTVAPAAPHQPAASASESPTRGIPHPARDPLLQPSGGFGPVPGGGYIALDGTEIRELVLALFDQLAAQLPNDLRFARALTYPRCAVRVTVDVETYPPESAIRIVKIAPDPKGQAPHEVALAHADQCCFVVMAQRREMNVAGDPVDPPDKIRDELGLPKPGMQMVGRGVSRQLVDIAPVVRDVDVSGAPLRGPDGGPG